MTYIDVKYLGAPHVIACGVIETEAGLLLVDPGPTVAMPTLISGLEAMGASLADVHALLLTHIHLDHAGASGSLVAAHPALQVYVHAIGATHMARPERLLNSARRLYGEDMDRLWGAFLAVPSENLHRLDGGEKLTFGADTIDVLYTPGHAIHHVSYIHEQTGTAYAGDTVGMRVLDADYVLPVAPPPDIDMAQWMASLDELEARSPSSFFLTHFGPASGITSHLEAMRSNLEAMAARVKETLGEPEEDTERARDFEREVLARVRTQVPTAVYPAYEAFGQPAGSWLGLARYWRKKSRRARLA